MEYKPFKCPDCSVWWRTETHKCKPEITYKSVIPDPKSPNWYSCPKCGKRLMKKDWHTCSSPNDWHRKDYPHDNNPPKRNP